MMAGCAPKTTEKKVKKEIPVTIQKLDLAKINYPTKIGDFELQEKKSLQNSALGIMIRYVNPKKNKAFLDCYIYPQKPQSSLKSEYHDIMTALNFMHQKGELKQLKTLQEDSIMIAPNTPAKRVVFDMENRYTPYYSVLYLSTLGDHYFKVRISNPHKTSFLKSDYAQKTIKELYAKIKFNK